MVVAHIELCPENGVSQEIQLAIPKNAVSPRTITRQPLVQSGVCRGPGMVYKPLNGQACGAGTSQYVAAESLPPQQSRRSMTMPSAPRRQSTSANVTSATAPALVKQSQQTNRGRAVGNALSALAQGLAASQAPSITPLLPEWLPSVLNAVTRLESRGGQARDTLKGPAALAARCREAVAKFDDPSPHSVDPRNVTRLVRRRRWH